MITAVKYALRNLANFAGRDNRPTFWWFVLAIYLLTIVLSFVLVIPATGSLILEGMHQAQTNAAPEAVSAAMQARMEGMMHATIWVSIGTSLLMIFLIAAAFVRRLHDAGLPGWVALVPLAINLAMLARMPGQVDRALAAMKAGTTTASAGIYSTPGAGLDLLLGWAPTLIVAGLALLPSTDGPNRYGEEPDDLA